MNWLIVTGLAVAYAGLLAVLVGIAVVFTRRKPPENGAIETRVALLEQSVKQLPSIWEEETARANRHRARAEQAERRHRQSMDRLEEQPDPGEDVRDTDGSGSQLGGVPPMRADVGAPQPDGLEGLAQTHAALMARRLNPFGRLGH